MVEANIDDAMADVEPEVEEDDETLSPEEEKKQKEQRERIFRCPKQHKIVFYQNGFKRRVGPNGESIQPRTQDLNCSNCKSVFQIGSMGYASCK